MARLAAWLGGWLRDLRASREELEAQDEERIATGRGTVPIASVAARQRACVSGVLRAVTFRPAQDKPIFTGQLFDGTGSLDLVWIGQRRVAGVRPGTHLRAWGMVSDGDHRPRIYNPGYELLAEDA